MRHPLSTALCVALLGTSLAAQTPLTGNVYDGSGGPLLSGTVYHATGNLAVPANQTLTIQAGAILKFGSNTFTVDGALVVNGTAASPAVLTSLRDDSAGGDTNGDGNATTPVAGNWWGINIRSGSGSGLSSLNHLHLRYAGAGGWAGVIAATDVVMNDCVIADCSSGGLSTSSTTRPTVARCRFERISGQPAILGLHIEAVPGLLDNVAMDCSGGNYAAVDIPRVTGSANLQIGTRNLIGGVLVARTNPIVLAGGSLTLEAGVVVKPTSSNTFTIDGVMNCNGTAAAPVIFTSFTDDSAGGDTNGDGPSSGTPGSWWGLNFRASSGPSRMSFSQIRYCGAGGWHGVTTSSNPLDLFDCTFADCSRGGLLLASTSRPRVERCQFVRILNQPAIQGVALDAVPGFLDNTAVDCSAGNYQLINSPLTSSTLRIQRRNLIRDTLVLGTNMQINSGAVVTLDPGVIVKPRGSNTITIDGTLLCQGTANLPVIFTSFADDSAAGDTNADGPSSGAPSQWWGINFRAGSDASTLEHTEVRYTGGGAWSGIENSADITLRNCRFQDCGRGGLNCSTSSRPVVEDCHFQGILRDPAIKSVALDALPAFEDNTASNCPGGAFIRVTDPNCRANTVLGADNQLNGALVVNGNLLVTSAAHLTLNSGVVLKFVSANTATVDGRLDTNGPVIFTHLRDDAFAGDTNGDGNSTAPSPGLWYGIHFRTNSTGFLDRCLVRWSGAGAWPGISCDTPLVDLVRSRVEYGSRIGFRISNCRSARGLTAFANGYEGIVLTGGNFNLIRSTSAYNSRDGIGKQAAWTGTIRSTISKFNVGADFAGFAPGDILFCNGGGVTGGSGNLDVDPLFVGAASGDLRLQAGSPCIDVGGPSDTSNGVDALGFPRYLDGDLDGVQRIDMGAHEFDNVILIVTGAQTPGATLTATVASQPGIQIGLLAYGFGAQQPVPLFNLGALYFELGLPYDAFVVATNGSTQIPIPNGIITPLRIVFQYIGIANPFPRGNTSNPAILEIR